MFLPYGRQNIEEDDIEAVAQALRADFLTTGPRVAEFEAALASITGAKEVIACSNGTTALHLAAIGLGIEPGDAVIVPSITFLATANAVRYMGADVIFADVDPASGLMGAEHAKEALARAKGKKVKAIFPVHLGGHLCDMDQLSAFAKANNLSLMADACHAIGGGYKDSPVGSGKYEDMATFSFHPVKTIAMGEGGAVTTNDSELANRLRRLRSHGMAPKPEAGPWVYEMPELGYNYRVTDIQCALGISQVKKLDRFLARRREIAAFYDKAFKGFNHLQTPPRTLSSSSGWHLYSVRIDFDAIGKTRAEVMNQLKEKGIGTQVHYIPVHNQPYYQDLYGALLLPGTQAYYAQTLSIPFYPSMSDEDAARVVQTLSDILI